MNLRRTADVTVEGAVLAADCWDGDGPRVVALHADVTDRRSWYTVAGRLDGAVELFAYDRRGFGGTPAAAGDFRHIDDLLAVLRSDPRPAWLLGNSNGGRHALDAVLLAPELVAGLILISPGISGAPPPPLDGASLVLVDRLMRAFDDGDGDEVARLATWMWLDGPGRAEGRVRGLPRALAGEMARRVFTLGAARGAGSADLEAWPHVADIGVPVTVACGEYDLPSIVDQAQQLVSRIPEARYVELPDTAHLPMLDQPEAVAQLIREAVTGL